MATRTIANGGGNWNVVGTWVEGAVPVLGDAVVATATSGNLVVNVASACTTLTLTNYVGQLTLNANLSVASNIVLASGMSNVIGTGDLINTSGGTLTSNGKTLAGGLQLQAGSVAIAGTWTMAGLCQFGAITFSNAGSGLVVCNGGLTQTGNINGNITVQLAGGTCTFAGGSGFSIRTPITITGNITITGTLTLALNCVFTYTSGTVTQSSFILSNNAACTINTNPIIWNTVTLANTSSAALTLSSLLLATTLTTPNAPVTFGGAAGFTVGTFTSAAIGATRIITLTVGNIYTINTAFTAPSTTVTNRWQFVSATPGTKAVLILGQGATQDLIFTDPTDIDSSAGQTIFTARGVITTTFNWTTTPFKPVAYVSVG